MLCCLLSYFKANDDYIVAHCFTDLISLFLFTAAENIAILLIL